MCNNCPLCYLPPAGEWQFIMGSAASESLFGWKRVADWREDVNCTVRCLFPCPPLGSLHCRTDRLPRQLADVG